MDPNSLGRVVHAADLHLGAPLDSLGRRLQPAKADYLRLRAAGAFDRLIEATVAVRADVLVLAGDVYDQADREVRAQVRFARGLERLADEGIPVFIAHGNHDPLVAHHRPAKALPPNVTVFQPGDAQVHPVSLAAGGDLHVVGVSFATLHESANLARRFHDLPVDPSRTVGVLHANVAGSVGHDPYAPCSVDDLAAAPVGYWALGHVHQRTVNPLGPGRWWAYSGNLQGRSTKATECGAKGALFTNLTAGGFTEPEFVACDTVRFVRHDVDVSDATDVGEVIDRAAAQLTSLAADVDIPLLVRVRLTGTTAAHGDLGRDDASLLELLREQTSDRLGDGEVVALQRSTRPAVAREQLLQRGDLVSALLTQLDLLRADDGGARAVADGVAAHPGLLRQLDALSSLEPELIKVVIDRVEQLLVDELVEP